MDSYQNKHSATQQTDAYGNPRQTTEELGNPNFKSGQAAPGVTGLGAGHEQGKLHRSGSSSSSSSEDDGQGGRRKKGMKEKIKEKLPGAHKDQQAHTTAAGGGIGGGAHNTTAGGGIGGGVHKDQQAHTTTAGGGIGGGAHEKKGIMDKVKEKLPGGNKDQQH